MRKHLVFLITVLTVATAGPARAALPEFALPDDVLYQRQADGTVIISGVNGRPLLLTSAAYIVSAQRLRWRDQGRTGELQGEVSWRGRGAEKREFRADTMMFSLSNAIIRAHGRVVIIEDRLELQANQALIDLDNNLFTANGTPARAAYDSLHFTAGALEYDQNTSSMTLIGQPALTRGDLKLSAFIMTWRPNENAMVATGEVHFKGGGFSGSGDEVAYTVDPDCLRISGAARLVRGRNTLNGAEIIYNPTTDRAEVTGPAKLTVYWNEGNEIAD